VNKDFNILKKVFGAPKPVASADTIRRALKDLGEDANQVAGNLLTNDCKGVVNCMTCPVAQYLSVRFGTSSVVVFKERLWVSSVSIRTPVPILNFIKAFDSGEYPQLER
jgi:hypothetical protein